MDDDGLFRQEALRRFREGGTQGQVLRLAPGWTWLAVTLLLLAVAAVSLWATRAEVETRTRFPAEVVSNNYRGMRTIFLRAAPTPTQTASFDRLRGPTLLEFYPDSGGPGIFIGGLATWDDRDPGVVMIAAHPAPPSLVPGTKGKIEFSTGRLRLRDLFRPGKR